MANITGIYNRVNWQYLCRLYDSNEEWNRNISIANKSQKQKVCSEQTRRNMSIAAKQRLVKRKANGKAVAFREIVPVS